MQATAVTPVEIAAGQVNLPEWWFTMPDSGYRAASKAHLAFGSSTTTDGKRLAVCLEQIGGALMLHHYEEVSAEPDRLRISSPDSRGWLGGVLPVRFPAEAELHLRPATPDSSELVFKIEVRAPNPLLRSMLGSPIMRAIITKHLREETAVFARDIAEKYAAPPSPTGTVPQKAR